VTEGRNTLALLCTSNPTQHSVELPSCPLGAVSADPLVHREPYRGGGQPVFIATLIGPPLGHTSVTTTRGVRRGGMVIVGWSIRGLDGIRGRTPEAVVVRVARRLRAGIRAALPELLRLLDDREWRSVGLDTLLDQPGEVRGPSSRNS
jgi:hypothetical protein